ncbi:MAG: hypothetical protein ACRD2U_08715 [Terriglobales bacterium]
MKTLLFAILFACATAAVGQNVSAVITNTLVMPDHPERAANHTLAQEQNLRGEQSPYTYAKGERPLSDFAMASQAVPLGDIARNYRREHASARKANIVWVNN